jgi:hypothetical protein
MTGAAAEASAELAQEDKNPPGQRVSVAKAR